MSPVRRLASVSRHLLLASPLSVATSYALLRHKSAMAEEMKSVSNGASESGSVLCERLFVRIVCVVLQAVFNIT